MKTNTKELSKETIEKAMACKTAEELMKLAAEEDIDLTKAEAEAYLFEMEEVELTDAELKQAAGGSVWAPGCRKNFLS